LASRQDFFQLYVMFPTVAKVVFVHQRLPFSGQQTGNRYSGLVLNVQHAVFIFGQIA
jgi:hypothetical protein